MPQYYNYITQMSPGNCIFDDGHWKLRELKSTPGAFAEAESWGSSQAHLHEPWTIDVWIVMHPSKPYVEYLQWSGRCGSRTVNSLSELDFPCGENSNIRLLVNFGSLGIWMFGPGSGSKVSLNQVGSCRNSGGGRRPYLIENKQTRH